MTNYQVCEIISDYLRADKSGLRKELIKAALAHFGKERVNRLSESEASALLTALGFFFNDPSAPAPAPARKREYPDYALRVALFSCLRAGKTNMTVGGVPADADGATASVTFNINTNSEQ